MLTEKAYAKVNLTLEVLRRRSDGYHDLASIVQTVDLFDTLRFKTSSDLTLSCDQDDLPAQDNLVLRAAEVLRNSVGTKQGAAIELVKRIPISAGLGGGSADAAATLRGLNGLWDLRLSALELAEIGASVGADVPFLVEGGTALMSGKGEELEKLPTPTFERLVLVVPQTPIADVDEGSASKTRSMFEGLSESLFTTGSLTRKLAARMNSGGDCHPAFMFNCFQQLAPVMFEQWDDAYAVFASLGANEITLTGSGPGMFAVAPTKEVGTAWAMLMGSRVKCRAYSVGLVAEQSRLVT